MNFFDARLVIALILSHAVCFIAGRFSKEKAKEERHSARAWWMRW